MRALAVVAVAALLLLPAAARGDGCPFADAQAGEASAQQLDLATVCLLAEQRALRGLPPLAVSLPLDVTATKYSDYIVDHQHFDHVDLAGRNVFDRVRADDASLAHGLTVVGENIAWGSYDLATPRSIVQAWMNSPEHRANILYPGYRLVGVGVAGGAPRPGVSQALTYVADFGKPAPGLTFARRPRRHHHHHHRHAAR
jgi:uncharacterized protein YkwD